MLLIYFVESAVKSQKESLTPSPEEIEAVKVAESGDYQGALNLINQISPITPSVLNNKYKRYRKFFF